jgi:hypothetical protein
MPNENEVLEEYGDPLANARRIGLFLREFSENAVSFT